jgi:hypothetical protein
MTAIIWLKHAAEYLGGERDTPPSGLPLAIHSPIWGLWWGVLTAVIALFSGQATKFIYIDF